MPGYRYRALNGTHLLIALISLLPPQVLAVECATVGRLVSVDGQAEKRLYGATQWHSAGLNVLFCEGDALRTLHQSRAAVRLRDNTLLRLDGDSSVTFTRLGEGESTLLDLLSGAVHFISRTTQSLQTRTPYVNAMIEGTEFVVRVADKTTDITVFEGTVVARNENGSVKLNASETAHAQPGQPPLRTTEVKPLDAVAWALYYPPLPAQPSAADELAQASVTATAQNRLTDARALAQQSLETDGSSAAAYMARSYVEQASFDIPSALNDMQKAVELAPDDLVARARLAEFWMMTGDLRAARQAATQAVCTDPGLSLSHNVLGFASLREADLYTAEHAFSQAILLDSAAPLPRLGSGLVKIRRGDLRAGREEIETAVLLDSNKALLRSYLGKAYYEEKRDELALGQLSMAKALDANDPTAWYYESIVLQSANRPVEALQSQHRAIELNDHRGVYRSRQLLDQDEAARTVSLGRIYNDLNFEHQAHFQATDALLSDFANHSAHRLLADSYMGIAYLDAARQSELLQSKLTQPLNLDPLQPQLSNANLGLLDGNGPGDLSYNEYNPLFMRNGLALQLDASLTKDNTWADDIILAGLHDNLAFSVGQYHKETDLVDAEDGYQQDVINGFVQYQVGANSAIQLETGHSEEDKGDVRQRLLPDFLSIGNLRVDNEDSFVRLGFNSALSVKNNLLLSAIQRDVDFGSTEDITGFGSILQSGDREISLYESQVTGMGDVFAWLLGVGYQAEELNDVFEITCASPFCAPWRDVGHKDLYQTKLYGYLTYRLSDAFFLTGGLTSVYEKVKTVSGESELRHGYPKLGFQWKPAADHEIRFAAFRNRASVMPMSLYETLEPTHVVGFNQLYDDQKTTDSENYGVAYNLRLTDDLQTGVSALSRRLSTDVTVIDTLTNLSSLQRLDYDDRYANLWVNWAVFQDWALGVDYTYNHYSLQEGVRAGDSNILAPDGVLDLSTRELSTSLRYFHPRGFIGSVIATYYDQEGEFIDRSGLTRQHGEDRGAIIDLVASYRFAKRKGSVSIGVYNLFDNDLAYEDRNNVDVNASMYRSSPSSFTSERLLFGEVSFVFR